jgi:hypothetical protein
MSPRSSLGLCLALGVSSVALSASAAVASTRTFDAVNGFEQVSSTDNDVYFHTFVVTGIVRGQATEQTFTYHFRSQETADRYYQSCERFALLAMKDAGHYAFIVKLDGADYVAGCRLEKR